MDNWKWCVWWLHSFVFSCDKGHLKLRMCIFPMLKFWYCFEEHEDLHVDFCCLNIQIGHLSIGSIWLAWYFCYKISRKNVLEYGGFLMKGFLKICKSFQLEGSVRMITCTNETYCWFVIFVHALDFYSIGFSKLTKYAPKFLLNFMFKMLEFKCGGMVSHVSHLESNVAPTFYLVCCHKLLWRIKGCVFFTTTIIKLQKDPASNT